MLRCIELCRARARARIDILRWIFFNVLTGNGDAHLKNLSFRVSSHGFELAPFYDLVSTESYRATPDAHPRWPKRPLSMPIGQAATFGAVRREDCFAVANALGVANRAAARLLDELVNSIEGEAEALQQEFEALAIPANIRGGQLRALRGIRLIVIRETAAGLRAR